MKDLLLRQAKVIDPRGPHNNKRVDILVQKGHIAKISKRITAGKATVVKSNDLHVSLGWVDTSAHFREPGNEEKETIQTGLDAAAQGGFTYVAVLPSTSPFTDSRSGVAFKIARAAGHQVRLLPIGALSKQGEGKELAELYDMQQGGAVAFSDDAPINNTRLLMLGLEYQKRFNGCIITYPCDTDLAAHGQMHEGEESVAAGMKGIPALAEEAQLARDLQVLAYTRGRMHIGAISTAGSVALVRTAKANGLNVTCSVAAHNLLFDDAHAAQFNAAFKVNPPLRTAKHIQALVEGLQDGTIDGICSEHRPEDTEHKVLEFDLAAFGAATIANTFAGAWTALQGQVKISRMVQLLAHGPRKVLGLPTFSIAEGAAADLTYFDPSLGGPAVQSRSKGVASPYKNCDLQGIVLGISQGT